MLPHRFTDVTPAPTFGALPFEMWHAVFSTVKEKDVGPFRVASRWAYNLYWDLRGEFVFREAARIEHVLKKANSTQVTRIAAPYNGIDDHGMAGLCSLGFARLQKLDLEGAAITDAGVAMLASAFGGLRSLNLRACDMLTDKGIAALVPLQRLERLEIGACRQLTDGVLESLGHFKQLNCLLMTPSPRPLLARDQGEGIEVKPEVLSMLRALVGDCGLSNLADLKNLTHLDVGPFMSLTTPAIKVLLGLPKLKCLAIHQGQLLDDEDVRLIGKMTSLQALALHKLHYASNVRTLTRLTSLRILSLKHNTLTNADLAELADFKRLEELDISGCHRITYPGLLGYTQRVDSKAPLQVVRMFNCKNLDLYETRPVRCATTGHITSWQDYLK